MRKKSTESVAASSPTWETLESFARQSMQQVLQRMLEEEVDGEPARAEGRRLISFTHFLMRPLLGACSSAG